MSPKMKLISTKDARPYYEGLRRAKAAKVGTAAPVILDTAMGSDNCGDQIIMETVLGVFLIFPVRKFFGHRTSDA